jgi:seryl-tRNA(Sec) selenium transferase
MFKIIVNVSENFEPGAESIGDFVTRAAAELHKVGELLNSETYDGDLQAAVKAAKCELIALEGEY